MENPPSDTTNWADLVSVFLAASAFVISAASLYLTSLRRPDIDFEYIPRRHDLSFATCRTAYYPLRVASG